MRSDDFFDDDTANQCDEGAFSAARSRKTRQK